MIEDMPEGSVTKNAAFIKRLSCATGQIRMEFSTPNSMSVRSTLVLVEANKDGGKATITIHNAELIRQLLEALTSSDVSHLVFGVVAKETDD
jgi:protein involved in ribonucleotide reduction